MFSICFLFLFSSLSYRVRLFVFHKFHVYIFHLSRSDSSDRRKIKISIWLIVARCAKMIIISSWINVPFARKKFECLSRTNRIKITNEPCFHPDEWENKCLARTTHFTWLSLNCFNCLHISVTLAPAIVVTVFNIFKTAFCTGVKPFDTLDVCCE